MTYLCLALKSRAAMIIQEQVPSPVNVGCSWHKPVCVQSLIMHPIVNRLKIDVCIGGAQ